MLLFLIWTAATFGEFTSIGNSPSTADNRSEKQGDNGTIMAGGRPSLSIGSHRVFSPAEFDDCQG